MKSYDEASDGIWHIENSFHFLNSGGNLFGSLCTMCDFLNFGLIFTRRRDNALFALKPKINVVWNFFEWSCPKGASGVRKISKNVDLSIWGNHATTQNNFFDIFKWDQNHENHT